MEDDKWPSNVNQTYELRSQGGVWTHHQEKYDSFGDIMNAFLDLGWRIINTYVEGKGPDSIREECVCLMGWTEQGRVRFPEEYGG